MQLTLNLSGKDALDNLPDDADDDEHDGEGDGGGREGLDQPQHHQTTQLIIQVVPYPFSKHLLWMVYMNRSGKEYGSSV